MEDIDTVSSLFILIPSLGIILTLVFTFVITLKTMFFDSRDLTFLLLNITFACVFIFTIGIIYINFDLNRAHNCGSPSIGSPIEYKKEGYNEYIRDEDTSNRQTGVRIKTIPKQK